jgi:hypothetical protein
MRVICLNGTPFNSLTKNKVYDVIRTDIYFSGDTLLYHIRNDDGVVYTYTYELIDDNCVDH